jgi:hypothetical protein
MKKTSHPSEKWKKKGEINQIPKPFTKNNGSFHTSYVTYF